MAVKKHFLDYNYIGDGIYIGTNQCCQMHFAKELLAKSITSDISLEGERVDSPEGVTSHLWLPTKDKTAPQLKQLRLGVSVLKELVKTKQKVYVHCKNGHGRAPTLVAAYFMSKGMTMEQALKLIAKKRPSIHLEESQKTALKKFTI